MLMLSMMLEASKMLMLPPLTASHLRIQLQCIAMHANLHLLTDYKLRLSRPTV